MNFIGNKKAVNFLSKSLEKGNFAQAYFFSGPESVGKFFLAKVFAKSLISGEKLFFAENEKEGLFVDLTVIATEVEEKKGVLKERDIPIEKVREALRNLSVFPHSGKKKVLIIDDAHKMSVASQNAILKTLEEPNSTSIIILVACDESKILPTIKSRCQKINFSLAGEEMRILSGDDFFEKYGILAMGRPGLLVGMLKKKDNLEYYSAIRREFENFFSADLNQKISYAEKMSKDIGMAIKTLNVWIWMLRELSLKDDQDSVNGYYGKISEMEKAIHMLRSTNANSRLILENLLINM